MKYYIGIHTSGPKALTLSAFGTGTLTAVLVAEHSVQAAAMYVSIRTTIFWNMLLLMIAAIALISFVVFRVTEREMIQQRVRSGEETFAVLSSVFARTLERSAAEPDEPEKLMQQLAGQLPLARMILINKDLEIVAHTEQGLSGEITADDDLQQALRSNKVRNRVAYNAQERGKSLTVCGPLYNQDRAVIGALKLVFPLTDVGHGIAQAQRIILFYILFDAAVLILFGTFLLSRYLVKPIDKIIKLADTIARGELDASLYLAERNEIGKAFSRTQPEWLKACRRKSARSRSIYTRLRTRTANCSGRSRRSFSRKSSPLSAGWPQG